MGSMMCPTKTILIVDDEDFMREALGTLLQQEGYEVVTAANGQEALGHLHGGLLPNLILLDLAMPVMDGWEFRRQQNEEPALAAIPVVVFTGGDQVRSNVGSGATVYVRKPVDMAKLLATIRRTCADQGGVP